jgi:hypothetical protein
MLAGLVIGLIGLAEARANEFRSGSRGGRGQKGPQGAAGRRAFAAPRMPRPANARRGTVGTGNPAATTVSKPTPWAPNGLVPSTYHYGTGIGGRRYTAYGYGRGYHNRYRGLGYGYGRSQGNNRAIVARLRAVHASLARLDHDYQGHRVRAMHAIALAIRQLGHRSMAGGSGFGRGTGNNLAVAMRRGGAGTGGARPHMLTQAQSDARMSRDLRTLQGISMQMNTQAYYSPGRTRALGYVQRAIGELHTALSIR